MCVYMYSHEIDNGGFSNVCGFFKSRVDTSLAEGKARVNLFIYIHVFVYTYICRVNTYVCRVNTYVCRVNTYICIYIYMYIHIFVV